MDIAQFIAGMFQDPVTNYAIALILVLPLIDFVTGTLRAVANKSFKLELVDVFVRTKMAGRAIPLVILVLLGRAVAVTAPDVLVIPGLDLSLIVGAGILSAVPFIATTIQSIIDNVNPGSPDRLPDVNEGGLTL